MDKQTTYDKIVANNPDKDYPNFPEINDAVIGVTDEDQLIYSQELCIQIFMKNHNWSREDAMEWFFNNVECCYIHPTQNPIFTTDFDLVIFEN
jgi:hypothetical protein